MPITPFILGTGRSGQAIAKSLAVLSVLEPEWKLAPARFIPRGTPLKNLAQIEENPLFCIANPHGLHAKSILDAEAAGFKHILCEKPACVNPEELSLLTSVKANVAVFHGYRMMWGPQMIKRMILSGGMGRLIAIEGRYWQSSAAERAVSGGEPRRGRTTSRSQVHTTRS